MLPRHAETSRIRPIIFVLVIELGRCDRRNRQRGSQRGKVAVSASQACCTIAFPESNVVVKNHVFPEKHVESSTRECGVMCEITIRPDIRILSPDATGRESGTTTSMEVWFNSSRTLVDDTGAEFPCPRGHANVTGNAAPAVV
jgi:hypothetical protein